MKARSTGQAENMGAEQMREKMDAAFSKKSGGKSLMETLLLGRPGGDLVYKLLLFLNLPGFLNPGHSRKMRQAAQKGALSVYKERSNELKMMQATQKLWDEHVSFGHGPAVQGAYYGHTGGAVKELTNLCNHAYMAENIPILGVTMDKKDVLSRVYTGKDESAAPLGELVKAYNAYYDQYHGSEEEESDERIRKLKRQYDPEYAKKKLTDEEAAKISVEKGDYQKFGFVEKGVRRKITEDKEELNLTDMYCLYSWLTQSEELGKAGGRDWIKNSLNKDSQEYQKMFTYMANGKRHEIADTQDYLDSWIAATGFTQDVMYGSAKDHTQKLMLFNLKGTGLLRNHFDPDNVAKQTKLGTNYKNPFDYPNRQLGRMTGMYVSRLFKDREKQTEELSSAEKKEAEAEESLREVTTLLSQQEEAEKGEAEKLTEAEKKRIEEHQAIVDKFIEDIPKLTEDEERKVENLATYYAEEGAKKKGMNPKEKDRYFQTIRTHLLDMAKAEKKRGKEIKDLEAEADEIWSAEAMDESSEAEEFYEEYEEEIIEK